MKMTDTWLRIAVFAGFGLAGLAWAVDGQETKPSSTIHIDIPVTLEKANVVFNLDHLVFTGDLPVGMKYMNLLAKRIKEMGAQDQIIGVVHSEAAYLTLHDRSEERRVGKECRSR